MTGALVSPRPWIGAAAMGWGSLRFLRISSLQTSQKEAENCFVLMPGSSADHGELQAHPLLMLRPEAIVFIRGSGSGRLPGGGSDQGNPGRT